MGATSDQMRVVICDDDFRLRSVISDLVARVDGVVLAETDSSVDTMAVIDRFQPDLVILDLALGYGSGMDVIDRLREHEDPPTVVVFTGFDAVTEVPLPVAKVVHKPDLVELERVIETLKRESLASAR